MEDIFDVIKSQEYVEVETTYYDENNDEVVPFEERTILDFPFHVI